MPLDVGQLGSREQQVPFLAHAKSVVLEDLARKHNVL